MKNTNVNEERLEKENRLLEEAKKEQKRLRAEIRQLEKMLNRKKNTLEIYDYEVEMEKRLIKKIQKDMEME